MKYYLKSGMLILGFCLLFNSCKKDSKYDESTSGSDSVWADSATTRDSGPEGAFTRNIETKDIKIEINSRGNEDLKNLELTINSTGKDLIYKKAIQYDGTIQDAVTADLNGDGLYEVYIFNKSAGSGSYGQLIAYQYNGNKLDSISIEELSDELSQKYLGHDSFSIDKKHLKRFFPIYNEMDPNCCPTGGLKELKYNLVKKPSGLKLLINVEEG